MRISISAFFVCVGLALGGFFAETRAGDHQWTVTNNGAAVVGGNGQDALLADVITAINSAITTASIPNYMADVVININAPESLAGPASDHVWIVKRTGGYKSVTINGNGNTLSTTGGAPILAVYDAASSVDINNVTASGGVFNDWGAGILVDLNTSNANNAVIKLTNVTASGNTLENSPYGMSQGAGIAIRGQASGNIPAHTITSILTNVILENNYANHNNNAGNDDNPWGGGAYITRSNVTYTGGRITGNKIFVASAGNAYGGGIATNSAASVIYTDVAITGNTATVDGTGVTDSYSFGGGIVDAGFNGNFTAGGSTYFDNNTAEAKSANAHAFGGGLLLLGTKIANISSTASTAGNEMFRNNKATSEAGEAFGGALATRKYTSGTTYDPAVLTITGVDFYNNQALGATRAGGGALYADDPLTAANIYNITMTGGSFKANKASASGASGIARGGAADIRSGGVNTFDTVEFRNNTASATGTTSKAFGGAIYQHDGTLNLANATITDNSVTGTATSAGGGVFVNTESGTIANTLNITATNGFETRIVGNKAGGVDDDIFFGAVGGTSSINGILNVSADEGSSVFLGTTSANLSNSNFTANYGKVGSTGKITLSGGQSFTNAATYSSNLNFNNGTTHLTPDYTAAFSGAGAANVAFGADHTLVVELDDRNGAPLFDFTGVTTKNITVTQGSTLDFDVVSSDDRAVESFLEDLVLARGVTAAEAADMLSKFTFGTNSPYYMQYAEAVHMEGTDVVLGVAYRSPFEFSGTNIGNTVSSGAIKNLVDTKDPITNIKIVSDDEFAAMLRNPNALHAELALDAGRVLLNGAARVSTDAIEMGLRKPHHAALQDGFVRTSRPVYSDEQDGPVSSDSANASTRLMDCARYLGGGNVRIWAGYIGDWGTHDADNGRNGYDYDRNGFLLGVNYDFGMTGSVGLFGGYSRTSADSKTVNAEVEGDNGHFGILGRFSPVGTLPELSFFADAGYHFADNDSSRSYGAYAASGSFDQDLFTLGVGGEYDIRLGGASITPFARFRYSHLNQGGLQEGGTAASATQVGGFTANAFQHNLGVEASYNFAAGTGIVTPSVSVDWQHNYGSRELESNSRYIRASVPAAFRLESSRQTRDTVNLAAGVGGAFNIGSADLYAGIGLNVRLGSNVTETSLTASLGIGF